MIVLGLIMAVLTLVVVSLMIWPLLRKSAAVEQRVDYDIVIYRDQLSEVDKEIERGLLTAEQAEAAKAEIYRRMLLAEDAEIKEASSRPAETGSFRSRWVLALVLLIVLPVGSGLLYMYLGSPELPGKPYAERKNDPDFIMATEAEQLAAELESKPDADGYKRLADTYFMLHRYDQSADAYQKAIGINGGNAMIWSGFGEAMAMARDGLVVQEARAAFTKALTFDPHDSRARFYLGLAEMQIGDYRRAVSIWKDLEKDSPADAPWLTMLKEHIAAFSKEGNFDPASVQPAPPSLASPHDKTVKMPKAGSVSTAPADVDPAAAAAVMAMKPDEQQAMIHKMVDRLAATMKDNPNDLAGWQRLAQAYRVLGETGKAKDAESKAAALQAK